MPRSKLDLELSRYLAQLNSRQKEAILALVRAYDAKQSDLWQELFIEQKRAIKRLRPEKKATY